MPLDSLKIDITGPAVDRGEYRDTHTQTSTHVYIHITIYSFFATEAMSNFAEWIEEECLPVTAVHMSNELYKQQAQIFSSFFSFVCCKR